MGKNIKLRKLLKDTLYQKYDRGHGTKKENKVHNGTDMIHSHNTYKTYMREVDHFADFCRDNGIKERGEAIAAVPRYLDQLQSDGKSAWTMSTALNAIAKAFSRSTTDWNYKLPPRQRANIERSRGQAVRDKHFSPERNQDLIKFEEGCGLRRHELKALKGSDLVLKGDKVYLWVNQGKGGKPRLVEAIKNKNHVVRMCQRAGSGSVFPKIHSGADIHFYRGNYAKEVYRQYARDLNSLSQKEKYYCRGDMKGQVFDREAMRIASENLGHNRIDVIANNYLYGI